MESSRFQPQMIFCLLPLIHLACVFVVPASSSDECGELVANGSTYATNQITFHCDVKNQADGGCHFKKRAVRKDGIDVSAGRLVEGQFDRDLQPAERFSAAGEYCCWWENKHKKGGRFTKPNGDSMPETDPSTMGQNQVILRKQKFTFPRARE